MAKKKKKKKIHHDKKDEKKTGFPWLLITHMQLIKSIT